MEPLQGEREFLLGSEYKFLGILANGGKESTT